MRREGPKLGSAKVRNYPCINMLVTVSDEKIMAIFSLSPEIPISFFEICDDSEVRLYVT